MEQLQQTEGTGADRIPLADGEVTIQPNYGEKQKKKKKGWVCKSEPQSDQRKDGSQPPERLDPLWQNGKRRANDLFDRNAGPSSGSPGESKGKGNNGKQKGKGESKGNGM